MSNLNERVLRQLEVDENIKNLGDAKHVKNSERLAKEQGYGETAAGKRFTNQATKGFVEKFNSYVEKQLLQPTTSSKLIKHLVIRGEEIGYKIDPNTIGRIIIRSLLRSLMRAQDSRITTTAVSFEIGRMVEYAIIDVQLDMHHTKDKGKLMDMLRRQEKLGDEAEIMRLVNDLSERVNVDHENWSEATHCSIGEALIKLFYKSRAYFSEDDEELYFYDIFVEHEEPLKGGSKKVKKYVDISDAGTKWLTDNDQYIKDTTLSYLPMVMEPQDWTIDHGGYFDQGIYGNYPLIKGYSPEKIKKLYGKYKQGFDTLMKTINTLQKTPFRVNETIWDAVNYVHQNEINLDRKGIPQYIGGWEKEIGLEKSKEFFDLKRLLSRDKNNVLTPESKKRLYDFISTVIEVSDVKEEDRDIHLWKEWSNIRKIVKNHSRSETSKNILVKNTLKDSGHYVESVCERENEDLVERVQEVVRQKLESKQITEDEVDLTTLEVYEEMEYKHFGDELYFCYNADYRGRIYPLAGQFSPQGSDISRGMLEFANGVEVNVFEDTDAIRQIAIVISNNFGNDKVSLDDRVKWTEEYSIELMECARDFENNHWWMEADKPFLFLQGCLEWTKVMDARLSDEDNTFVSTMPISFDGSCNGIQHYSALFLDEVGAKAVNLVNSEVPSDVYQEVADQALVIAKESKGKIEAKVVEINEALEGKLFGRKVAKRSVMTLPYGVSKRSSNAYVYEEVDVLLRKVALTSGERKSVRSKMGSLIWEAILLVVEKPVTGKEYFQSVATEMAGWDTGLLWLTPTGFPVTQNLKTKDVKPNRVRVTVDGETSIRDYPRYTSNIDAGEQANAIAPNFVHSFDSSHLQFSVLAAFEEGMTNFLVIHDSFATDCLKAGRFNMIIREQFVKMYSNVDYITKFHNDCEMQLSEFDEDGDPISYIELATPKESRGNFDINLVLESEYFFS